MRHAALGLPLVLVVAAACGVPQGLDSLNRRAMMSGAIFTTDSQGTAVNQNIFQHKTDVFLNGGPPQGSSAGLPDGTYVIGVTEVSGSPLLSPAPLLTVDVSGGQFARLVQLAPFATSGNGVYKVWVTNQRDYPSTSEGSKSGFDPSRSKTDNFRVLDGSDPSPTPTPESTPSATPTASATPCNSPTPTPTPSATPTYSPTPTPTATPGGGDDGDVDGNGCGDSYGAFYRDIYGNIGGDVYGDIYGDVFGNINGDVHGNLMMDLYGNINGDVDGDIWGDVYGNINGSLHGALYGNLYGNIAGGAGEHCTP